jgi:Zn-dependent protease with chaperone function
VTAHELMHLKHTKRDNATMVLNLLGAEVATAVGFNLVRNTNPKRPSTLLLKYLALSELVVNAAQLLWLGISQNWFTRRAEKEADVGAAKAVGSRPMIESLQTLGKLEDAFHDEQEKHGRFDWRKYTTNLPIFFTHPPIPKRIDNILKHTPKTFTENYEAEAQTPSQPHK